jgi:hypothetical protein
MEPPLVQLHTWEVANIEAAWKLLQQRAINASIKHKLEFYPCLQFVSGTISRHLDFKLNSYSLILDIVVHLTSQHRACQFGPFALELQKKLTWLNIAFYIQRMPRTAALCEPKANHWYSL